MNWEIMEVIRTTGAIPNRLPKRLPRLTGISTDSRTLKRGELFIALKGSRFDGHQFVPAALEKGAGAVLAQDPVPCNNTTPCLFVPDTLAAYGTLANAYRKKLKTRFLALTGSMGKTSTKEMAAAILAKKYRVAKTDKNENNRVGVPKTLLGIGQETEAAVIELGSNIPGEISLLTEIVQPNCALITNIAPVHLERFKTLDGVRIEKSALFWRAPKNTLRCVNLDDENIGKIPLMGEWPTISYGSGKNAQVRAEGITPLGLEGTRFTLAVKGESVNISLRLLGLHQVKNALAAATLGVSEGIPLRAAKEALEAFHPPKGRLEQIPTASGSVILDDTYNANPEATKLALQTLAMFNPRYVTIALLGDMLELGEKAASFHKEVGTECARQGIKILGVTGNFRDSIRKGALENGFPEENIFFFDDEATLLDHLSRHLDKRVMILVKGSRGLQMDRWIEVLLSHTKLKGRKR